MSDSQSIDSDTIDRLVQRKLALSTLKGDNRDHADNLLTAIIRGDSELFRWRVGAELDRGDIVAIYVPLSDHMPSSEEQNVARIYSVAGKTIHGEKGWHYVFLHRRLELHEPLDLEDFAFLLSEQQTQQSLTDMELRQRIGLKLLRLQEGNALLNEDQKRCFWERVFDSNEHLLQRAEERLLFPDDDDSQFPQVAISFAGEDWEYARRLKLWCDAEPWTTFLATPVEEVIDQDRLVEQLEGMLYEVYKKAACGIVIIPECWSKWIEIELTALMTRPDRLIFARIDNGRLDRENLQRKVEQITERTLPEKLRFVDCNETEKIEHEVVKNVRRLLRKV